MQIKSETQTQNFMKNQKMLSGHALIVVFAMMSLMSFATTSAAVTYSISPNPASVNENAGHLTFTITRSSSSGTATIYASTVQDQGYNNNNGYYVGVLNQTISFSAGQSTAQVSVTINDLALTSGSEIFRFIVQQNSTDPISTYLATDNFTINNTDVAPPTYSISSNPASVNENAGHLTFTITRSSSSGTATIYASTVQDQGYSNGNGYYVGVANQAVNFSAGQSTAQVSVTINDLGLTSGSEVFRFIVQKNTFDPVSTYLATDNFTINNTDVALPTFSISPNPASVNENSPGLLNFTITRSSSSSATTVYVSTVQDQGYSNSGYYVGLLNQAVNFSAGQSTAQVSVTIHDMGLASGSETFRLIAQQNPTDPVSIYLATDNFVIVNNDTGSGAVGPSIGLDARDTGIAAYATQIQAAGYSFIGQYVGNEAGYLTASEASEIQAAHLKLFTIYEKSEMSDTDANKNHTYSWQTYFSESQGEADAARAYTAAIGANQPFGTAIYFAIDLDPGNTSGITEADALNEIDQYFHGLQYYFNTLPSGSTYTIGVYGAGDTLTRVMADGLAKYSWLASPKSWAGFSTWDPTGATSFAWNIHQVRNLPAQPQYGSIQIDTDETSGLPFGAWNGDEVLNISATSLTLPPTTIGTAGATTTFTVSGSGLGAADTVTLLPPAGSEISQNSSSGFNSSLILSPDADGNLSTTTVYARIGASATANISGNLTISDALHNSLNTSVQVNGSGGTDTTPPTISPNGLNYVTNWNLISLSGNASDNIAVTAVTWSNNLGGSGTASGTTAWTISNIALQAGTNPARVRA